MKMIGGGAGNRLPPQAHDEERNEEGGQSIALDLLEFEIPNDCTDAQCKPSVNPVLQGSF